MKEQHRLGEREAAEAGRVAEVRPRHAWEAAAGPARRRVLAGTLALGALAVFSHPALGQDRQIPPWLDKLFELLGIPRPPLGAGPETYTDDQYSVVVRERIYLAHLDTFSRKPWPFPQLGAVQVRIEIDAKGRVAEVRPLESTGYPILREHAERIVRESVPYPLPPPASLRRGRAVVVDTIVFDNDWRFVLKSVAERKPKLEVPAA